VADRRRSPWRCPAGALKERTPWGAVGVWCRAVCGFTSPKFRGRHGEASLAEHGGPDLTRITEQSTLHTFSHEFNDLAELQQHLPPRAVFLSFLIGIDLDQSHYRRRIDFGKLTRRVSNVSCCCP
jgi:hypothetical protein